jgi:NADH-quinone oxidoreductase subunit F
MVDVARYFIEFTRSESCGKCTPCRVGLDKALRTLTRITKGQGREEDLAELNELGRMIRETSLCGLGQSGPNPVLTALRHFRHEFEDHILGKRCTAGVCQDLALSPCENTCPLHMNIPRFLQLYQEGRMDDAFEAVIMDNPLPASTGRVCQHHCDTRCRRRTLDEPVNMREVHRVIADSVLLTDRFEEMVGRILAKQLPASGKKVAVVGAGPAGLTAAFYLGLLGHAVTVFESRAEAGGMLRYALPEYRLAKSTLDREVEIIRRLGVQFVFNARIGADVSLDDLAAKFDATFLSIGTWKETDVRLPGNDLNRVYSALNFFEAQTSGRPVELGEHAVVIGGGNSAVDCARTAIRRGSAATVIYRRERRDMPAIHEEVEAAEQEGVRFLFLTSPHRILGQRGAVRSIEVVKTRLGEFDTSGRRRPIDTGEISVIGCSSVILAVGEGVETDFYEGSGLTLNETGMIEVDRYTLETSRPTIFAGGDLISGPSNVSRAMSYGKDAARSIDHRLMDEPRFDRLFRKIQYAQAIPEQPSESRRHRPHDLPAPVRARTFEEAVQALTPEEAHDEACRCLRCDVRETVTHR